MGLVTEYSLWFIPLCLLLGALYAFLLYFRTGGKDLDPRLVRVMTALRFLFVSILSFLLLSPLIRSNVETVEKPVILIVQDNSESIAFTRDSAFYRKELPALTDRLSTALSKRYEVIRYSFSDRIAALPVQDLTGKRTDLSALFNELGDRYYNRNVGALVLLTDGIYNQGSDPYYASERLKFPIYPVALGDTLLVKDIILKKILFNRNVFLGDRFPAELTIDANKCDGGSTEVTISKAGNTVFRQNVQFLGNRSFHKIVAMLEAREKGINRYTVTVRPVEGEFSKLNNSQDIFVDVTDTRQKILILYDSPHPDIAAIKSALDGSSRFETEIRKSGESVQPAGGYDLVLLYQLPSLNGTADLSTIISGKVPLLFVLGTRTDYNGFNRMNTGLQITSRSGIGFSEAQPYLNTDFPLFTIDKEYSKVTDDFPPLVTPFGEFLYSPVSDVLTFQKIGSVRSRIPQILFINNGGRKVGIIAGENIWKWRLSDYRQKGNHDVFNDLVNKVAQYLSVREDRSFLIVKWNTRGYENDPVRFDAELYNQSYELINGPDITLTVTDENGTTFPFTFGKTEKAYTLDAGTFPVGTYRFQAVAAVGNATYRKSGEFTVEPVNFERLNTQADHNLLYRIARAHDGEMFYPNSLDLLEKKILEREDIRPVSYWQKKYADLAGNGWVFALILSLVTAEWFLRKRSGIY